MNTNNWIDGLGLKDFIQKAWINSGFPEPVPVQKEAVPLVLGGKDAVVQSPTGSGKTLAYVIPILEKIDTSNKNIQAMIITPSHELAMQIFNVIQQWSTDSGVQVISLIGGANVKKQQEALKKHPQVAVGTTGRILELIKAKKLKMHEVKTIVVDEVDVLLAKEHEGNLKAIIKTTLRDRQILFFSATISDNTKQVAKEILKEPIFVEITQQQVGKPNTEHIYLLCEEREKIDILQKIIRSESMKTLVFTNDLNKIDEIEAKLLFKGFSLGVLSSNTDKNQRKKALTDLRAGKISTLVATDVAARGLDIEGLTHVINLDLPYDAKQYTHRAGRTGRMGSQGTVISIVNNKEENILKRILKSLNLDLGKKRLYMGKITD